MQDAPKDGAGGAGKMFF